MPCRLPVCNYQILTVSWTYSDMQATPAQFVEYLAAELFQSLVNERLFKLSRQDDPPFYVAQVS